MNVTYMRRKAQGICVQCGIEPSWQGKTRCAPCGAENCLDSDAVRSQLRELKLCIDCRDPAGERARCPSCAEKSRARRRAWGEKQAAAAAAKMDAA